MVFVWNLQLNLSFADKPFLYKTELNRKNRCQPNEIYGKTFSFLYWASILICIHYSFGNSMISLLLHYLSHLNDWQQSFKKKIPNFLRRIACHYSLSNIFIVCSKKKINIFLCDYSFLYFFYVKILWSSCLSFHNKLILYTWSA